MQSGSPQKRNKKASRTVKKDIEYEPQGHLKQQIEVFMRHHMVEKKMLFGRQHRCSVSKLSSEDAYRGRLS